MRLIDACKLQNEYKNRHDGKRLLLIDVAPTVDAVPVVRCSECKYRYYYENDEAKPICTNMEYASTPDDWFCADGERKGEAE